MKRPLRPASGTLQPCKHQKTAAWEESRFRVDESIKNYDNGRYCGYYRNYKATACRLARCHCMSMNRNWNGIDTSPQTIAIMSHNSADSDARIEPS